jgi:hypothetical protein
MTTTTVWRNVVMAVLAIGAVDPVWAHPNPPLQGEYSLCSRALHRNVLGDPECRNVSFLLPPSYWQRRHPGGPFAVADYPIVLMLTGNNMYRNEGTIDAIVAHRRQFMDADLLAAGYGDFKFDQDAIAYDLMATGQTPEFILIEISGLSSYGGTRYDCSKIFGDMRSFVARDLPRDLERRFRVRPGRDNWFLTGFSMGAGGALAVKLQDRANRWGTLVMLSPSNNDLSTMAATTPPEPRLINNYRNSPQTPQSGIPVNRVAGPEETALSWGNVPGGGSFFAGSVIATYQIVAPDVSGTHLAPDGMTPLYTFPPLTGPDPGQFDTNLWALVLPKGLKQMIGRAAANLTDTVTILGRGNNKLVLDATAPTRVVLHSEVPDQPALVTALTDLGLLDAHIQTQGDHFTSLPHTFPAALKRAFELMGSKTGRPFTYSPAIEQEHASCAAQFPGHGRTPGHGTDLDQD